MHLQIICNGNGVKNITFCFHNNHLLHLGQQNV